MIYTQKVLLKVVESVINTGDASGTMLLLLAAVALLAVAGIAVICGRSLVVANGSSNRGGSKTKYFAIIGLIMAIIIGIMTSQAAAYTITAAMPDATVTLNKTTGLTRVEQVTLTNDGVGASDAYLDYINVINGEDVEATWTCKYKGETIYQGTGRSAVKQAILIEEGASIKLDWTVEFKSYKDMIKYDKQYIGRIDYELYDEHIHQTYDIQSNGDWKCHDCGEYLDNTKDAAYIVLLDSNGQPLDADGNSAVIPLTAENVTSTAVGTGTVVKTGNNIVYTNTGDAQTVVIRTTSEDANVEVNAANDSVKHYDQAGKVNIVAVANKSFHEFGTVPLVEIKKGHIELEPGSDVNGIYIYNETVYDENGKATDVDGEFEEIKITVGSGVDQPKLSRSAVAIDKTNGTKVCTLVTDESKEIYLFQNGIYQQIKVADIGSITKTWIDQADTTTKVETAADQLSNDWHLDTVPAFAADDETRSIETATNKEDIDKEVKKYNDEHQTSYTAEDWVDTNGTVEEAAQADSKFKKGTGTEADPYQISTANEWYNLCTMNSWGGGQYYIYKDDNGCYVEITDDIDYTGWELPDKCYVYDLHLDGKGHTLSNVNGKTLFDNYGAYLYGDCTFKDFNVKNCNAYYSLFGYGTPNKAGNQATFTNVKVDNCTANGGTFLYYCGAGTAIFNECEVTNTNVIGGYMASGGYVGNIGNGVIKIDKCTFGGSVVSTQSVCAGFVGQPTWDTTATKVVIKDSTILEGTIIRNVAGGAVAAFDGMNTGVNYANSGNAFKGVLETADTTKAYKEGTDAEVKEYTPICTADDFSLNKDTGEITYTGDTKLGKVSVQCYVTNGYVYYGNYYGGYNHYICDPIKATDVAKNSKISGIPILKDMYNVVSSPETPVGLQTTDTTYVGSINNNVLYYDALTYSWGHYMLDGTYNSATKAAVEPTSLNVYIRLNVYNSEGALDSVIAGAGLQYTVDLSNHGKN